MPKSNAEVSPPQLDDAEAFAPWTGAGPTAEGEYVERRCDDVDWRERVAQGVTFEATVFVGAALARSQFPDARLRDVRIDRCDLAGADWRGSSIVRAEILGTRMVGFGGADARLRDLLVRKSPAKLATFENARFDSCRFEDCDLSEALFQGATLRGVTFRECDLAGANFAGATLENVDVRGCRIDGILIDVGALSGLVIDPTQTLIVAELAGVRVENVEG